jgi:hypothetical protein
VKYKYSFNNLNEIWFYYDWWKFCSVEITTNSIVSHKEEINKEKENDDKWNKKSEFSVPEDEDEETEYDNDKNREFNITTE